MEIPFCFVFFIKNQTCRRRVLHFWSGPIGDWFFCQNLSTSCYFHEKKPLNFQFFKSLFSIIAPYTPHRGRSVLPQPTPGTQCATQPTPGTQCATPTHTTPHHTGTQCATPTHTGDTVCYPTPHRGRSVLTSLCPPAPAQATRSRYKWPGNKWSQVQSRSLPSYTNSKPAKPEGVKLYTPQAKWIVSSQNNWKHNRPTHVTNVALFSFHLDIVPCCC